MHTVCLSVYLAMQYQLHNLYNTEWMAVNDERNDHGLKLLLQNMHGESRGKHKINQPQQMK
jgi:hypothetical protein